MRPSSDPASCLCLAQNLADAPRIARTDGGILTNHVITKDTRFKAAMTGASSTLYRASYGHDQYQLVWEQEMGLPWENAEGWEVPPPSAFPSALRSGHL